MENAQGKSFPCCAPQFTVSVTKDLNTDVLFLAINKLVLEEFNHILNVSFYLLKIQ